MFYPEDAGVGTWDIVYTYTDPETGCTAECGFQITVNPLPWVAFEFSATEVCLGEEIVLTATGPEDGAYPYQVEYLLGGIPATFEMPGPLVVFPFAIPFPGEYAVEGVGVADANGCSAPLDFSVTIIVNDIPELTEVAIEITSDGETWDPVEGGLMEGYEICLNPVLGYALNISSLASTIDLGDGYFGFYHMDTPDGFFEYWAGRGVDEFATPGTWQAWMWMIINGDEPIFYIYNDGGNFMLVDGLKHDFAGVDEYLAIPGDYPVGDYTFDGVVLSAAGCASEDIMVAITFKAFPTIVAQPMDADVLYGGTAVFTVEAENATGYQWFGPDGEIVGAMDATLTIEGVMPEDAGDYYVVVGGECGEVMSDMATLTVLPWEQCIDLNGPVNGASTYLDLMVDDIATIFAPVDLNAVEFYAPSMVYVPGGVSFAWDEAKGAKVSIMEGGYPTQICVEGYPTLGTVVNVPAGWSLLPVWSPDVVAAADVFGPLGDNLQIVMSIDYSGIYWPLYSIYTLENLVPGSAYLIKLGVAGTVDFDVPAADAVAASYVAYPRNLTSWNDVTMTGVQHSIAITTSALESLQIGDVIGAFNQDGLAIGMVEVTDLTHNIALRAYAYNEGDVMTFRVYRDGEIIDLDPTFDTNLPNTNVFTKEGMSAITEFKAGATSVIDLTSALNANVYPNPATDFVNIETNFEIRNLKVVNYVGQVVFDRNVDQMSYQINTSNFGPGMYFVQIESTDGTVITKRLSVN
jgi:hypothetical protein